MIQLKKIDILFFCYICITTILLIFSGNELEKFIQLFLTRGIVVVFAMAFIYLDSRVNHSLINLLRNGYPILFSLLFYTETVHYNKLIFNNLDKHLVNLDQYIFGFQPSVQFSYDFSNSVFSELMYLGYFSLYILIILFVFITYYKLNKSSDELFFKLTATMLMFYLFFCFFPSAGPQFYFNSPEKDLPTALLFDKIIHFIQQAEQPTGAFPSSHIGISIVILHLIRKRIPTFFYMAIPFVILLIFSTVYIKAHYAIDAITGIISVPIMVYIADLLYFKTPELKLWFN